MPAEAGIQPNDLDSLPVFMGMMLGQLLPTVARQLGSQHTAAISLNSRRSFSHEAPRSSLR